MSIFSTLFGSGGAEDEVAVAIGKHQQYPWKYTNILTGDDTFTAPKPDEQAEKHPLF